MQLAHHAVHVERLAASTWSQTKEVGVVSQLVTSFLTSDVNGNRHTLAVGIVYLQRGVLAVLDAFLVHQAGGCIAESEEAVVVHAHAVAVARKGVDEQFQLVVCPFADMDAEPPEAVLQVVGRLLQVDPLVAAHHEVIMHIDQLLAFPRYGVLHPLDVLHGHQVRWIGDAGMAVLLLFQCGKLFLLAWHENHLVVNHCPCVGYAVYHRHQVHGHLGVVYLDFGERAYQRG